MKLKIKPMKQDEYYSDMRSLTGCVNWLLSVGLSTIDHGGGDSEVVLEGSKNETHLHFYYDCDDDDLDYINCMNRLRRWYETGSKSDG